MATGPDTTRSAVATAPGTPDPGPRFRHQIEAGVSISGRFHFPGDARIDGHLKGEIRADQLLLVGERAVLEATVSAQRMVLAGTLRGDVIRSGTIELEGTARLLGDVEARHLVVHEGAFFDGRAVIGRIPVEPEAPGESKPSSKRSDRARRRANA